MAQHMVKEMEFKCPLTEWQYGTVLELVDLQGPVHGSTPTAVYIQMLHPRNGRGCLMFILRVNMKQTLTGITTGSFGSGNTDNLKALITRKHIFHSNPSGLYYIRTY